MNPSTIFWLKLFGTGSLLSMISFFAVLVLSAGRAPETPLALSVLAFIISALFTLVALAGLIWSF